MGSAHLSTIMFFSRSCSKVRAEPKVLDSRLSKHAFLFTHSVGRRVSRAGYQTARWQETTTSGDPRQGQDRQLGSGSLALLIAEVTSPAR